MEFRDFLQSSEHNESANEQTKRELLDIVVTKANEAHNELPYPKMTRICSDDYSRIVSLTDWTPEGRYYGPPVCAEIIFTEKNLDGFDVRTSYEFLENSDGLSLAKYIEMHPARDEEAKQAEQAAMELLSESMESEGGLGRLMAFLDDIPEQQKQRMDEEMASEEQEWLVARTLADQMSASFVSESEAQALLSMIRTADWNGS